MKIYMIRHGQTDWNKVKKLQGQVDIPLNEYGRRLAIETAPALAEVPFDIVYTSPLMRARETAELVIGGRDIPIIEEPRIREISFGAYEGLCYSEQGWNIPDKNFMNFFQAPEKYQAPEDGETFEEVSNRVADFLQELFANEELKEKTVLLSTHGAALCGILRVMKGAELKDYWGKGLHKNCAVTIVEVHDGQVEILEEKIVYYKE